MEAPGRSVDVVADLTTCLDVVQVAEQLKADYGKIDYVVHSIAMGPEVTKPLLETSRMVRRGSVHDEHSDTIGVILSHDIVCR